jgi:hypothetical protein
MANVIIGIHGLGNKPPVKLLERWWKLAMAEGLKAGGFSTVLPPFELAFWADIIYKKPMNPAIVDTKDPCYLNERYVKAPQFFPVNDYSNRKKVVEYIGRQMNRIFLNEDLTLNYSYITDAIINRYFNDLEIYYTGSINGDDNHVLEARQVIRERLSGKLIRHRDDNIMLISHSMGSIIAFDVLTFMVPEVKIHTFITMGSPLGLPLALSKIASELKQTGNGHDRIKTPPGITGNWYNFSDILDKVAFNYKLSEYFSENQNGIKPVDLLVINNYEIDGIRNPHKSFGYLRTPEFAGILNEFILSGKITLLQKITRKILQMAKNLKNSISSGT